MWKRWTQELLAEVVQVTPASGTVRDKKLRPCILHFAFNRSIETKYHCSYCFIDICHISIDLSLRQNIILVCILYYFQYSINKTTECGNCCSFETSYKRGRCFYAKDSLQYRLSRHSCFLRKSYLTVIFPNI